jgi:hypothetical protein
MISFWRQRYGWRMLKNCRKSFFFFNLELNTTHIVYSIESMKSSSNKQYKLGVVFIWFFTDVYVYCHFFALLFYYLNGVYFSTQKIYVFRAIDKVPHWRSRYNPNLYRPHYKSLDNNFHIDTNTQLNLSSGYHITWAFNDIKKKIGCRLYFPWQVEEP